MQIIDILVSSILSLIMFGVGLSLKIEEFIYVYRYPKAFLIALTSQMIALPMLAFFVVSFGSLPDEIKVGFIILAASPGGATSGFITHLFRANVALSISLTTVNSILTLFTIPIIVNLALHFFLGKSTTIILPFWETFVHILSIALIPAMLGLLVHRYYPKLTKRIEKPAKYLMIILLAIVFTVKTFAGKDSGGTGLTIQEVKLMLSPAILLNVLCLMTGYMLLKLTGFKHSDSLTAAIESGVHNTTLAFLIAGTILGNQEMVKPALVYSMFSFFTAVLFSLISSRIANHPYRIRTLPND